MDTGRIGWSDLGLTALLVSAGLLGTGGAAANQGLTAPTTSYVLVLAACLPIAVSHWRPAWTAALAGAATVLVACLAAVAARTGTGLLEWSDLLSAAACVAVPAAVGVAVKVRRDAAADVRAAQARRTISEERLWLAQDVHDVVGHGLAVIAMQAGVALRMLDRDPAQVRQALEAIREASREALDGVRAELAALRQPERPGSPLRPNTGIADLPALADRIRSSGLPVEVEIDGTVTGIGLPTEVDRSAYRIVQESLTNVLRHGGPGATARVRVEVDDGALRL